MKDVMIDIETLGNTYDAVMIQLGACFFDRKTGEIGKTFSVNIDRESCKANGFKENAETLKWWSEQNQEIFNTITTKDLNSVDIAMKSFNDFLGKGVKDLVIWSHATFDFVIVQNYLTSLKAGYLPFRGARDIRTLVDLSGINLDNYDWSKKTHDALDDCKFQVAYCVDAMNKLNPSN